MPNKFIKLILFLFLFFIQAAHSDVRSAFGFSDVVFLNSFSNSHEVYRSYLSLTGTPKEPTQEVKKQLMLSPEPMPKFVLLEKGEIGFEIKGKRHIFAINTL